MYVFFKRTLLSLSLNSWRVVCSGNRGIDMVDVDVMTLIIHTFSSDITEDDFKLIQKTGITTPMAGFKSAAYVLICV